MLANASTCPPEASPIAGAVSEIFPELAVDSFVAFEASGAYRVEIRPDPPTRIRVSAVSETVSAQSVPFTLMPGFETLVPAPKGFGQ